MKYIKPLNEFKLSESDATPTMKLAQEIEGAEHHMAYADKDTYLDARSTKKTWDDGVPVLKYIARSSEKSVRLPKQFEVVVDNEYGWYYWESGGTWYGAEIEDGSTPPFEY
jgi:hypothetical protein